MNSAYRCKYSKGLKIKSIGDNINTIKTFGGATPKRKY
jgi:hypothetical protein